jgi:eukaryotic-like serine/threonine-protein kinase
MAESRSPSSAADSRVFARARELFESALDWPPAERDDRLTNACAGDKSLRLMIDRMLQADAAPHRLLDRKLLLTLARLKPGDTIGTHLEIVALIGSGGMGEVYRAHDSSLGRDVAIKVLRWTAAIDADAEGERLQWLRREAHLLAALNHPNIASYTPSKNGPRPTDVR